MAEFVITGLEPVKRNKGWFELLVKGKPPFFVDEETVYRNSLKIGELLSESRLQRIRQDADLAWLKHKAMKILSRRMISERDLRRKLSAERKPAAIRDEVISQLRRYGFIDDSKYAAAYIRSQIARSAKSRLFLKKKLWEKGIGKEVAERIIDAELEGYDEETAVMELTLKKYKTLQHLPVDKAKARLINFLKGKGFSWDTIKSAIAGVMENGREDY